MNLPDGSVLMHGGAPYDPKKAHEYYLRTRKLKGRKRGATSDSFIVTSPSGKSTKLTAQQLNEQKAYADARIASIKKKLTKLEQELKKRLAEARRADTKAKRGPTAADKAKAAREAKKYRDKNQQKIATAQKKASSEKKAKPKADSVAELKKTIEGVKQKLSEAIAKQRSLSSATKTG